MTVKLLTEHHLEFLSLKGGCIGSSESTLVKMPHCWKSHVVAHVSFDQIVSSVVIDLCILYILNLLRHPQWALNTHILAHLLLKTSCSIGKTPCEFPYPIHMTCLSHPRDFKLLQFRLLSEQLRINIKTAIFSASANFPLLNDVKTFLTSQKCNNNVTHAIDTVWRHDVFVNRYWYQR